MDQFGVVSSDDEIGDTSQIPGYPWIHLVVHMDNMDNMDNPEIGGQILSPWTERGILLSSVAAADACPHQANTRCMLVTLR